MNKSAESLKTLQAEKEFFIGIDSDGCVFDTMEIKHKECFCPNYISFFSLQGISKYAREAWEFVNLYSTTRGINRFKALIRCLDLLENRKEIKQREFTLPKLQGLRDWVDRETKLGNPALSAEVQKNPDPDQKLALEWSEKVNKDISWMVKNLPPFPYVAECLNKMEGKADKIVVSQTPFETLNREWTEHGINSYVREIAGQECGTKTEHLQMAAQGKYDKDKILMIGDAPGDLKAAQSVNALFYPILPGQEDSCWKKLYEEGLDRFFSGTFSGNYQQKLLKEYQNMLPEYPDW